MPSEEPRRLHDVDDPRGFAVTSPVDGSVVASLPELGAAEVRAAVARLRRNQPAWEALGASGRGEWVGRLRDWLFDNDERVAELLQRETGKPWQEASLEVPLAIDGRHVQQRPDVHVG
jgi:acyl-CoA reductase-like NAD-dependent aldehyde dehydrogenase